MEQSNSHTAKYSIHFIDPQNSHLLAYHFILYPNLSLYLSPLSLAECVSVFHSISFLCASALCPIHFTSFAFRQKCSLTSWMIRQLTSLTALAAYHKLYINIFAHCVQRLVVPNFKVCLFLILCLIIQQKKKKKIFGGRRALTLG